MHQFISQTRILILSPIKLSLLSIFTKLRLHMSLCSSHVHIQPMTIKDQALLFEVVLLCILLAYCFISIFSNLFMEKLRVPIKGTQVDKCQQMPGQPRPSSHRPILVCVTTHAAPDDAFLARLKLKDAYSPMLTPPILYLA